MNASDYTISTPNFLWLLEPKQPASIVISVPHDAPSWSNDFDGLFVRRTTSSKPDVHAWIIALEILKQIPVYVIRNTVHRAFLEVNVPETRPAFLDPNIKTIYQAYHQTITRMLKLADGAKPNSSLLIDLHGFSTQPAYGEFDVILGTRNRRTIRPSCKADIKMADLLRKAGISTFLPQKEPLHTDKPDRYNGGETIWRHGQNRNAIQIEVDRKFRTEDSVIRAPLVSALTTFITAYSY